MRGATVEVEDEIWLRVDDIDGLVGRTFAGFPHWRGHPVINAGESIGVALDPAYHDERRGLTANVHIVARKTAAEWAADNTLSDVTGAVEALTVPAAGDITVSQVVAWGSAAAPAAGDALTAYDVVLDFGDCTTGAAADGKLDPEDIILPLVDGPALRVLPNLTAPGPLAFTTVDYGTDFERAPLGAVCTPAENMAGAVCAPGSQSCPFNRVCVDSNADGTHHCSDVDPSGTPACPAATVCVNTNDDEIAHCQGPAPRLIEIPFAIGGYDGLTGPTLDPSGHFRLRGRVVHPSPVGGPRPLVVIAHGRHIPKHTAEDPPISPRQRWQEQPDAEVFGQNYEGYGYLQEHLASHGFISVSVDLDEALGFSGTVDFGYPQISPGIEMRGWLILKNIEDVIANLPIGGSVDTSNIHLLGHSRGGEAVLQAWRILQDVLARGPASSGLAGADAAISNFTLVGIKSVTSIAPTSFESTAPPLGTTPFLLLFGTNDGDVNGFQSVVRPMVHLDRARAAIEPASAVWILDANHNGFSNAWPSDDNGPMTPALATPSVEAVTKGYVLAWLRQVSGNDAYRALFETSPTVLRPLGVPPGVGLHTQSRLSPSTAMVIDNHQSGAGETTASSGATLAFTVDDEGELVLLDPDNPDLFPLIEVNTPNRFAQDTTGLLFNWSGVSAKTIEITPSGGSLDLSDRRAIVLRAAQEPKHPRTVALGGPVKFSIKIEDSAGNAATVETDFSAELMAVRGGDAFLPAGIQEMTTARMQDVRIPLDRFRVGSPDLDLSDITAITLTFGGPGLSPEGRIGMDDLEFEQ